VARGVGAKIRRAAKPVIPDSNSIAKDAQEKKSAAGARAVAGSESPERSAVARLIGEGEEARGFFAAIITIVVVLFAVAVYFMPADKGHSGTALTFLIQLATAAIAFVVGRSRRGR